MTSGMVTKEQEVLRYWQGAEDARRLVAERGLDGAYQWFATTLPSDAAYDKGFLDYFWTRLSASSCPDATGDSRDIEEGS